MIVTVAPGDTLSGLAAQYGDSLSAVEAANPSIDNPNVISVGETVIIPSGGSWNSWSSDSTGTTQSSDSTGGSTGATGASAGGSSSSSGGGYHIPGVSDATAACIAFKESTNGQGSANVFQLSNYYPGESLAQQEQAAGQYAATQGVYNAWGRYDGC